MTLSYANAPRASVVSEHGPSATVPSVATAFARWLPSDTGPPPPRGGFEPAAPPAPPHGIALFVNARTDVYLRAVGAPEGRLDETVRRAEAYLEAGAARASAGSSIAEAVYGHVRRAAAELLDQGTYTGLADGSDLPSAQRTAVRLRWGDDR